MATLYVASTETFVGKSALCVGLLDRARHDGFRVGYMKPVSVLTEVDQPTGHDEDAIFVRGHFGLSEALDRIAPIQVTASAIEAILRDQRVDYVKKLRDAYVAVSRNKDLTVLEGANHWAEGTLIGLSADQISQMLQAPVLLVSRYHNAITMDAILAVQRYLSDRLIGVVLTKIDPPQLEFVRSRAAPYLEQRGVPVLAALPNDPILAGIMVADLLEHLGGQLIGHASWTERMVDDMMIGAMGTEAALAYFRRQENKVVITGGDRTDLQLVALETSVSALVLTGNQRPSAAVIDRAEECQTPIIVVADDTGSVVERADALFGRARFKRQAKVDRMVALINEHLDFSRLYDQVGLIAH